MKKALSAVLAVVLVLGVCFSVPMIASGADTEDLTFVLNDEGTGYIVTDCNVDANGELVIPEKYAPEVNIADPVNSNEGEGTEYDVIIDDKLELVTLSVDPAKAAVGATVTVTVANVAEGYQLTGIVVTDSAKESVDVTKNTDTEYIFVMPASNVDVTATYQEKVVVPETYTITGVDVEGGKVEADAENAKAGDKVTLTVTETAGYRLKADTLKVNGGAVELAEDKSFTMPAGNVIITAEFEKIVYTVAITDVGEIVGIATDKTTTGATVGDTVTVLVTVAETYVLNELIIKDAAGEDVVFTPVTGKTGEYTFTMPASNVTITATYAYEELPVVGIAAGAFEGCTKLTKITIGKNIATIGEEAFKGCTKLEAFAVAEGNTAFVADNAGVLYNYAQTKLIAAPYVLGDADITTEQSINIPATVEVIAKGAFQTLGELDCVFGGKANLTVEDNNDVLTATVLHKGMTTHTEDDGTTTDATCMQKGETVYKCEICAKLMRTEEIDIDETAHNMSDWETVTPATCTQEGVKRQVCTNKDADGNSCTHYKTDIINKLQHVKSEKGVVTTQAKCGEKGVETFYCKTCDYVFETKDIDALEHKITEDGTNNNVSAKTEATCTEDGSITGNCDHCGKEVTLTLTKTGHKYIEVVDAEATCTVNGWQHEECEYCGDYLDGSDMELKAPGHVAATVKNGDKVELKWTVVKAPTCSEDGFAEVRCANCGIQMVDPEGEIEYTRVLPATGKHDFGETWTVTKAATCEEEGEETGTCACGYTKTRKIDALGHKWAEEYTVDTAATCTKKGSESIKCTVCGEKDEDSVRETALAAHTADDTWKTVEGKAATCYAEGEKTGTCTVCKTENCVLPIAKLDHKWAAEAVNLKADIEGTIQDTNEDGTPKVDEDGKPVMVPYTYEAPTCEDKGYKAVYCENTGCTAHKEDSLVLVDALGHDYDDTYNTDIPANKAATCKEAGYMFKWCKTCSEANKANENKGYVKIELAQKAHEYEATAENLRADITIKVPELDDNGNVVLGKDGKPVMVDKVVSAPDCENPGYTAVYCKNYETCGEYKDVTAVEKLGHKAKFADWTKDETPATCTTKAFETNTCSRCNETMTQETGDFAACVFETEYTFEYPTCEEAGRKYYKCSNTACKKISGEVAIDALGHKHATDAKWVGTDATCTEDGEKVKECLNLFNKVTGEPYKAPANNTPATQAEGDTTTGTEGSTTTTPATRPAAPEGYEYCEGAKQVTKATGHKFADTYTEDKEPTCLEAGKESRHCTNKDCTEKTGSRDIPALGHNYSETYKTVTPATCQAEGKEARYCTNEGCTEYSYERKLAKTSHIYLDTTWDTIKAPTCDEKGVQENFCSVCNKANDKTAEGYTTRETNARGHSWALDYVTEKATCTTAGATYIPCERAGCDGRSNETILPATGHNWATEEDTIETAKPDDAAEKEKAVTCTEDGYEYKYCKTCEVWIGEVIKAEGHKYDGEPKRVDPTCYSTGSLTGKCVNTYCDAEDKNAAVQVLPKLDHTWGDWELRKDDDGKPFANCTDEDSMIRKCTAKGCTIGIEYGENENHTESGWILDADATCSKNGKMHTECTVCKFEMNKQTLYATEAHEYEEDTTKRVEPTCVKPGSKTLVCKNCEDKKVEEIAATDHTFTEWKVFVEPTCTEKGIRQSVCTVCLTTKSEKILALGHDLGKDVITAPTCTVEGSKHQECSRCDYKTTATPIAALGHNYTTSNTCSAKDCDAQLYEYKLIGESKTDIEITKYNGSDKNVVIPSEIDGYIVKAIGDRAFMNIVVVKGAEATETTPAGQDTTECKKSTIETVTIPETVTTIGAYAFASASDNFKSVVIPGTVTTIGDYAFGYNATITWEKAEAKEGEKVEDLPLVEKISATTVNTEDFTFAIYGVKDSAAAVYAAQDPKVDTDDFKFAAIADVYEVEIPEEFAEVAEKAGSTVLFKEFKVYEENAENKKSIAQQIAAVVDINAAGYTVEVEASQSYRPVDEDGNVITENCKDFYGTGTKVFVKDNLGNVVDVIEIAVQGDVNGDGISDAIDCMLIQLAAQKQKTLDGVYYTAGNITSDTAIDANDFSAAVLKIFGEDHIVGGKEEATTVTTTAPTTTEPTTQAPASTEPSTEGTSGESTPAESTPVESTPAESTPAATESQPVSSEPAATTTTTQAPAPSESTSDTPAESTPAQAS